MAGQSNAGFSLQRLFDLVRDLSRKLMRRKGSKNRDGFPYMEYLPDEILMQIFSHLPAEELANKVSQVCCRWQRLCRDPRLWKVEEVHFTPGKDARGMRELWMAPHLQRLHLRLPFRKNFREVVAQSAQLLAVPETVHNLVMVVDPRNVRLGLHVLQRVLGSLSSLQLHSTFSKWLLSHGFLPKIAPLDDLSVRTFWELVFVAPRLSALSFINVSYLDVLSRWETCGAPPAGPLRPHLHTLTVRVEQEVGYSRRAAVRRTVVAILRTQASTLMNLTLVGDFVDLDDTDLAAALMMCKHLENVYLEHRRLTLRAGKGRRGRLELSLYKSDMSRNLRALRMYFFQSRVGSLVLEYIDDFVPVLWLTIVTEWRHLTSIYISKCTVLVFPMPLADIFMCLPRLERFSLSDVDYFQDGTEHLKGLTPLVAPSLETLQVGHLCTLDSCVCSAYKVIREAFEGTRLNLMFSCCLALYCAHEVVNFDGVPDFNRDEHLEDSELPTTRLNRARRKTRFP